MTTTLEIQVIASADDCYVDSATGYQDTAAYLFFGVYNSPVIPTTVGMRFQNVTIPTGVTITSAYIKLVAQQTASHTTENLRLYGQKSNAAAAFSSYAEVIARTKTTAYADWTNLSAWTAETEYDSPEIKTIIQELVDYYGGLSSANIAILSVDNGTSQNCVRYAYSYDGSPTKCAILHIEYSPGKPTVTTQAVSAVGKATATGNGNVASDGGATITERGVCYCLTSHGTPDTGDGKAIATGTTGAFTASITGLTPSTGYYARAYAINSAGTAYGDMVSFTTQIAATYFEILTADRALALDNATAFTPSTDYNPATKKYADDRVSDVIYSADWDGVTGIAPSKNAVFDKIQALAAGGGGDFMADGSVSMTGDLNANNHQVKGLIAPDAIGKAIRQTAKITEAKLESATDNDPSTLLTERGSILTRNATIPAELKHGVSGQVLTSGGHGADANWAFGTACFGLTIDGGSSEITSGIKGYVTIPYACTIVAWYITGDVVGACVIDVWKAAGAIPTVANTIAGTEKPTLSSAAVNSNTNLTTWTVTVSAGDIIGFNVVSNASCKKISLVIKVAK